MFKERDKAFIRNEFSKSNLNFIKFAEIVNFINSFNGKLKASNKEESLISAISIFVEIYNQFACWFHFFCDVSNEEYHLELSESQSGYQIIKKSSVELKETIEKTVSQELIKLWVPKSLEDSFLEEKRMDALNRAMR